MYAGNVSHKISQEGINQPVEIGHGTVSVQFTLKTYYYVDKDPEIDSIILINMELSFYSYNNKK